MSVSTASRVLNGHATVNAELRARVEQAMQDLRFRPNRIAQTLYHHRSHTIGCILPDIGNPFFSQLFLQLEIGAFERGYTMILGNTVSTRDLERTYLRTLAERQVDGLLFLGGLANDAAPDPADLHLVQDVAEHLPVVVVNGDLPGVPLAARVRSDEAGGMRDLLSLLRTSGHRDVAFLGGRADVTTTLEKLREFDAVHPAAPPHWRQVTGLTIDAGREAMTALLDGGGPRPTAAVCINDLVAAGALAVARDRGVDVPGTLSLAGFDDVFVAQVVSPPLTSVNHNYGLLARTALDALLDSIDGSAEVRDVAVPTVIAERASIRRLP
ncbi:LacI family transcriptional regulator/LacI family repressor for deo operon, udp, cdd, tsx, nupC, and nupG [Deinococcus metalli]|uniref:LacI family transcriptional regulator/LacI family repressor for deo operon, udp, cdd, tsx, nupC, and nupG n=1 Tax=Deinococcus metalli TaxID=1141878 RepID=A0A7W8KCN5_9DEIO|nr:LacI family transcriptional regulator/LacI family repressor for deo operon, udp, cdd, tsx, nupC, and nupG [Deinococcus metalli]